MKIWSIVPEVQKVECQLLVLLRLYDVLAILYRLIGAVDVTEDVSGLSDCGRDFR